MVCAAMVCSAIARYIQSAPLKRRTMCSLRSMMNGDASIDRITAASTICCTAADEQPRLPGLEQQHQAELAAGPEREAGADRSARVAAEHTRRAP